MLKIAVFVSGRGSNLKAIHKALLKEDLKTEIKAVISDKLNCEALNFAEKKGISVYSVSKNNAQGYLNYSKLFNVFNEFGINFIVLAGFLKKIPDDFIKQFERKIINIHPALLPKYGGKGMYGMNVHRAVFNSSEKFSGATVHFVNEIYDNGTIIEQRKVDVSDAKSPEEIAERVLKIEHILLPSVIKKFAENRIFIENGKVIIK